MLLWFSFNFVASTYVIPFQLGDVNVFYIFLSVFQIQCAAFITLLSKTVLHDIV